MGLRLFAGRADQSGSARLRIYSPRGVLMNSPYALRLRGKLARRNLRLDPARRFCEAAIQIEGPEVTVHDG